MLGLAANFERKNMSQKKGKGRPKHDPPRKMFFGVQCTPEEKQKIWQQIYDLRIATNQKITVSEFFMAKTGIR